MPGRPRQGRTGPGWVSAGFGFLDWRRLTSRAGPRAGESAATEDLGPAGKRSSEGVSVGAGWSGLVGMGRWPGLVLGRAGHASATRGGAEARRRWADWAGRVEADGAGHRDGGHAGQLARWKFGRSRPDGSLAWPSRNQVCAGEHEAALRRCVAKPRFAVAKLRCQAALQSCTAKLQCDAAYYKLFTCLFYIGHISSLIIRGEMYLRGGNAISVGHRPAVLR